MGTTYRDELTARVTELRQCITELAVIAFEDRPAGIDLIAVDELCDRVSDVQGLVHELRRSCGPGGDAADQLDLIGELLEEVSVTYWRELRRGRPLEDLAAAGRRRNDELQAWADSLVVATTQCEEPLVLAVTAWRKSWPELLRARRSDDHALHPQNDPISTVEVRR